MKRLFKLLALILIIALLCSCGKKAPFQEMMSEDGIVYLSFDDLDLGNGSIGLPFFPPDITEETYEDYIGMSHAEYKEKYYPDANALKPEPSLCIEGMYAYASLSAKQGSSGGLNSPYAYITFTCKWDNTPEEWEEGTKALRAWLDENAVKSDEAKYDYISKDGRTKITVKLSGISGSGIYENYEGMGCLYLIFEYGSQESDS
jgi:hypothetical protein